MNEEFCFWSFSKWKLALENAGFHIRENANNGTASSRVYVNPWIQENRYKNHAVILDTDGTELPWPPTNMILVAEKTMEKA